MSRLRIDNAPLGSSPAGKKALHSRGESKASCKSEEKENGVGLPSSSSSGSGSSGIGSDRIEILRLVRQIEAEEKEASAREKEESEAASELAARRLVREEKDEEEARRLQIHERRLYDDYRVAKEERERTDFETARYYNSADLEEHHREEFQREERNAKAANIGEKETKALRKAQVKAVHEEHKATRKVYRDAKFYPDAEYTQGLRLVINLPRVLTSNLSLDRRSEIVCVECEAKPPTLPLKFEEINGEVDFKKVSFACDLSFNDFGGGKVNLGDLQVTKSYDKETSIFEIIFTDGKKNNWLHDCEIFAKYKNGTWMARWQGS